MTRRRIGPVETLPPLEREEQAAIVQMFRKAGFKVRSTSQKREARVSPGIPDLMISNRARGIFLWFEVKAYSPKGYPAKKVPRALEPAQVEFRDDAVAAGHRHYWGGRWEAGDLLYRLRRFEVAA